MLVDSAPTPPPIAVTQPVTFESGITSPTLHGYLIPNSSPGFPVSWYFEYGRTTPYGSYSVTPTVVDGTGTTPVNVQATISDPTAGSIPKYVRLVVVTADGCKIYGQFVKYAFPSIVFGNRFRVNEDTG